MARLWTCGFELRSAAAAMEVLSVTGTPSISTTVSRGGGASLRINPAAAIQYAEQQITGGVVGRFLHRFYLRVAALPAAATPVYSIGQSGYFPCYLRLTPNGALRLFDAFLGVEVGAPSAPLTVGQWYRIEIDHTDVAGAENPVGTRPKGDVIAYLDGANFSGTTQVSNVNGFSRIRMGTAVAGTMDIHLDDVAVNDTAGTVQNSLPGPGRVVHLRPAGTGDASGWATAVGGTAGAANNWTRVSEITPDDATSYNQTTAAGTTTIDDYTIGSPTAAGIGADDRINVVHVGGRIGSDAATAASIVYRLKSQASGTVAESGSVSVAVAGWRTHKAVMPYVPQLTSYTDPQTGTVWTRARLAGAQIGVRGDVSQVTVRRVSALWATVDYQPRTAVALGTATETSAAQPLTAPLTGTPISTLTDTFTGSTVDTAKWPDSYEAGGFTVVGGRARIACTTSYNALASAEAYRLRESSVHVRMWPPAAGGATTEAWSQLLVQTAVLGTDCVFEMSAVTGLLVMASRTAYWDPEQVAIPYDPVAHAWLRIRETGGQLRWDTSPDGITWTTRRATASPAWVGDTTLQVQLIAHRDGGVDDYAEFDNVNTTPGQALPLVPAAESASAQPVYGRKVRRLGVVAEVSTAQSLTKRRARLLSAATETTTARAPGRARARVLAPAGETTAGRQLAAAKRRASSTSLETASARALTETKRRGILPAGTVETALPIAASTATVLAPAVEETTARPAAWRKTSTVTVATGVSVARPVVGAKRRALSTAVETSSATPASKAKQTSLDPAANVTHVRPLDRAAGLLPTEESSTARTLGRAKTTVQRTAGEVGEARPVGRVKAAALGGVAETATARPLTGGLRQTLGTAAETSAVRPLSRTKSGLVGLGVEVVTARPAGAWKRLVVGAISEATAARTVGRLKQQRLGTSVVIEEAGQFGQVHRARLGVAAETDRALIGPTVRLAWAAVSSQARPLAGRRQRPADVLTADTTGPVLTPSTSGPHLAASVSGPSLTATSTGGG